MQRIVFLAPALAALALAGCAGGSGNVGSTHNRSLDSVHQPVVSFASYVFDADASDGMLSPTETRRVNDWFDAMEVRYGDRVAIDEASSNAPRAARDTVAMLIARRGMLLQDSAPITTGDIAPGRMRVVITRSSARVDGCPDWSTRHVRSSNTTTSNYGCATNANLAAMVADASDLVHGTSRGSNDPLTASKAISTYRNRPPTGAGGLSGGGTQGGGGAAATPGGGQ